MKHFSKGSFCSDPVDCPNADSKTERSVDRVVFYLYAVFRIVVEYFREPDAELIGHFTRGQFFSLFLIAIGVAFVVAAKTRPTYPRKMKKAK